MLLTLLILLCVLLAITYTVNGKDFLSPSFLLVTIFVFGSFFAFIGNLNWKIEINDSRFIFAIIGGVVSVLVGEMLVARKKIVENKEPVGVIKYSLSKVVLLILVDFLIVYLYYKRVYAIATAMGFKGEYLLMYVRVGMSSAGIRLGWFFTIFNWIVQSSAFICFYILLNNLLVRKRLQLGDVLLLIPCVVYFVQIFLSGARAGLIRFFLMTFFLSFFLYRRNGMKINVFKTVFISSIVLSVLFYLFALLGTFTKKVNEDDFINPICVYAGSSIIALDDWFSREEPIPNLEQVGISSFGGAYSIVHLFSGKKEKKGADQSNFVRSGYFASNLYTGFRAYLTDFGWPGLILICLFLGVIFRYAYQYILDFPSPINVLIYTYFLIDFLYLLFAQSITSHLFTPISVMGIVWIILVYFFLFPRKKVLNA